MIGIITVNWRGYEATRQLAGQLLASQYPEFRLIVVNNSPDETGRFTDDSAFSDPRVRLLHSTANTGYSGGINRGLKELLPDPRISHFLLLNNDVEVEPDFLSLLLQKGSGPRAIYGPVILLKETGLVQNTGGRIHICLGGTTNLNKNAPLSNLRRVQPDFLSGCILFMPRAVVEQVGLFDEVFGSYYEDVDFCLRAKALGVKIEILWDVVARHFHSLSTAKDDRYKIYLLNRNQLIFAKKHLPLLPRLVFIAAALVRGAAQNLLRGRLGAYLQGVKEGLAC
jgi:GT2 family glycosyltransferase